ncbi:NF038132 family protein [Massilia sp. METH4]|uniref:NF038132 family protein n=1 Tax=Massilia sp. METH4 TaxID=3123041 RepID=UPI0030D20556
MAIPTRSLAATAAAVFICAAGPGHAQVFDAGMPPGWQCTGNCGTAPEDGDITLAPGGGAQYGWVSTNGGAAGVRLPGIGVPGDSHSGSTLRSHLFTAQASDVLQFQFNYVTTDGGDFSDYAWVRLLHADGTQAALLATARTAPGGGAVPGFGMPAGAATLDPPYSNVEGITPTWSPLGGDSGECYVEPCGQTGWITADYAIAATGQYMLEFGVVNWVDPSADTGLAFDAISLDGVPLAPIPEPGRLGMLAAGVLVLELMRRWRRRGA